MNADDITLQGILNSPNQYLIPVFQRYYSWKKDNWEQLWEDITSLLEEDSSQHHFMGALVFVPEKHYPGKVPVFQVIDGQQRLLTLSLLLCAIRNAAIEFSEEALAGEITKNFLIREYKAGREHFRVFPRQRDRSEYIRAVEGDDSPAGSIGDALRYFANQLQRYLPEHEMANRLRDLFNVLQSNLDFVHITLDKSENPYQIFRSLNSTGVDLSEGDLIRNFVFMHVPIDKQDRFDDSLWQPLESHFHGEEGKIDDALFSTFFRHFLLKDGDYVPKNSTFYAFEERYSDNFEPKDLAQELTRFASYYDVIRGKTDHSASVITQSIRRLNQLSSTTAYPLLLNLMNRLDCGQISESEFAEATDRVTGFIMRRLVCGESSRAYVRWFPSACRELADDPIANLTSFLTSKGFPSDERFIGHFTTYNLYDSRYTKAILCQLEESHNHKEPADLSATQVEHIMPQTLSDKWRANLGSEAEQIHAELLDVPGNLTLSGYNPELYNKPFHVKKQEYGRSNVVLTRKLAGYTAWTEAEIKERSRRLGQRAASIWKGPPFDEQ